jgi:hypothetical protein
MRCCSGIAEQGFAGDCLQPPLVPRSGFRQRLKPSVRGCARGKTQEAGWRGRHTASCSARGAAARRREPVALPSDAGAAAGLLTASGGRRLLGGRPCGWCPGTRARRLRRRGGVDRARCQARVRHFLPRASSASLSGAHAAYIHGGPDRGGASPLPRARHVARAPSPGVRPTPGWPDGS